MTKVRSVKDVESACPWLIGLPGLQHLVHGSHISFHVKYQASNDSASQRNVRTKRRPFLLDVGREHAPHNGPTHIIIDVSKDRSTNIPFGDVRCSSARQQHRLGKHLFSLSRPRQSSPRLASASAARCDNKKFKLKNNFRRAFVGARNRAVREREIVCQRTMIDLPRRPRSTVHLP